MRGRPGEEVWALLLPEASGGGGGWLPGTRAVRSSGQPGSLRWGLRRWGGERQCRPRGRCGPWPLPERQPVGLNLQGHGRRDGRGNEGDKRATGDGDETRMQR